MNNCKRDQKRMPYKQKHLAGTGKAGRYFLSACITELAHSQSSGYTQIDRLVNEPIL